MYRVETYSGSRTALRPLFELAEDSASELDRYLDDGRLFVAIDNEKLVGHIQLTETADAAELEIKNLAVASSHWRRRIGTKLIAAAIDLARTESRERMVVATATADTDNLRFYQRCGFRLRAIERDIFTPERGYQAGTLSDEIELRDRVWLDLELNQT